MSRISPGQGGSAREKESESGRVSTSLRYFFRYTRCAGSMFGATPSPAWVAATGLCVWFLLIHAPVVLAAKSSIHPLLVAHLIGAYSVYLVCVHNTILTPTKLNGAARPIHVWVGRVGLALGVFGFVTGFILVWAIHDFRDDLGFSIGITYGGFSQMHLEYVGYKAIKRYKEIKAQIEGGGYKNEENLSALRDEKDGQLTIHIQSMINLFVLACGIPALMRICDVFGYQFLPILLAFDYGLSYFMARPFMRKMKAT